MSGVDDSLGVTNMVVVAVVRDAPLEGDTPLTQLVVPETTEKTKGRKRNVPADRFCLPPLTIDEPAAPIYRSSR